MSTLTQVLLAAVLNYLGFNGEVKDQYSFQNTQTVTELRIPCIDIYDSCNYIEVDLCDILNENVAIITKR